MKVKRGLKARGPALPGEDVAPHPVGDPRKLAELT